MNALPRLIVLTAAVAGAVVAGWSGGSTAVCVFAALFFAVLQWGSLTLMHRRHHGDLLRPVQALIRAMKRVERGHYRTPLTATDIPAAQALLTQWNELGAHLVERERAHEARLLANEYAHDRMKSVLDSLEVAVYAFDPERELVLVNRAGCRLLDVEASDLDSSYMQDLFPGELSEEIAQSLERLQHLGTSAEVFEGARMGAHVINGILVPARAQDGGVGLGTVLALTDASHKHEVRRAKDKFLSSVSHELRTPLTSICSYSELLQEMVPGTDTEWPEFVKIVHDEGTRLAYLVDELLDYVHVESGETHWHDQDFDLAGLVDDVLADVQVRIETEDRELEWQRPALPCQVRGDRQRLAQALWHLLDNAIKFTPQGTPIRVALLWGGRRTLLTVEDGGQGIPEELHGVVFEEFQQPKDHLTEKPKGLGLGLPLARAIVERHEGTLSCGVSELGGARFSIDLPRLRADAKGTAKDVAEDLAPR